MRAEKQQKASTECLRLNQPFAPAYARPGLGSAPAARRHRGTRALGVVTGKTLALLTRMRFCGVHILGSAG